MIIPCITGRVVTRKAVPIGIINISLRTSDQVLFDWGICENAMNRFAGERTTTEAPNKAHIGLLL